MSPDEARLRVATRIRELCERRGMSAQVDLADLVRKPRKPTAP